MPQLSGGEWESKGQGLAYARDRPGVWAQPGEDYRIDFECASPWWQTPVCLKDDSHKTLLGREGELLYEGRYSGIAGPEQFLTTIGLQANSPVQWVGQDVPDARYAVDKDLRQSFRQR